MHGQQNILKKTHENMSSGNRVVPRERTDGRTVGQDRQTGRR